MWNPVEQSAEDVQVIEINNQIELLPNNERERYIDEDLCKKMLSKVKENINYLHLQSVNNRHNSNSPEVDVEYKVTNGSLNNQDQGNYSIENVEIKKKVKQENEDEIQDSIIKIQNNRFIKQKSLETTDSISKKDSSNFGLGYCMSGFNSTSQNSQVNYETGNSHDIYPLADNMTYSSNEQELLKKYLEDAALQSHIKPIVKIDLDKKFYGPNIYPICSKPRGYCLIINNVDFKIHEKRKGSDLEAKYLKGIFEQLNFEIITYRNMTSMGMLDCFKNIVKRPELEHHDTFISIILTHGDDSKVLIGTDASRLKVDSFLHNLHW